MKKLMNQALGREPESLWMSVIGAACAFILPVIIIGTYVAWRGI
ncbi:hypothetical protein [Acidicapsa acidisoli]|nr:hypothetical protein [Acidicapsa acidisoli]